MGVFVRAPQPLRSLVQIITPLYPSRQPVRDEHRLCFQFKGSCSHSSATGLALVVRKLASRFSIVTSTILGLFGSRGYTKLPGHQRRHGSWLDDATTASHSICLRTLAPHNRVPYKYPKAHYSAVSGHSNDVPRSQRFNSSPLSSSRLDPATSIP